MVLIIYCHLSVLPGMLMSSETERNSPKNENHRSECGKCYLRESRFQNFPWGRAYGPPLESLALRARRLR